MKTVIAVLLCVLLSACTLPSVRISIKDMNGFGNEEVKECELINSTADRHPCVIEISAEWKVDSTSL